MLWHIKSKNNLTKLYFRQFYITRILEVQGSFCDLRILIRFFPGHRSESGWPKKTGSGCATLVYSYCLDASTVKYQEILFFLTTHVKCWNEALGTSLFTNTHPAPLQEIAQSANWIWRKLSDMTVTVQPWLKWTNLETNEKGRPCWIIILTYWTGWNIIDQFC